MKVITASALVIMCSLATALGVRQFDEQEREFALAKAFNDGKTEGQQDLRNQIVKLKCQIDTLVHRTDSSLY